MPHKFLASVSDPQTIITAIDASIRFPEILTACKTKYAGDIDPAVTNRSHVFGFNKVPPDAWLPSMQRVLAAYGITNMSNNQLLTAAAAINGSGRQFATCVKQLIDGYYQMFPHLVPPHLQLANHNTAPIAAAQPLPVLPVMPSVLQVNTVSTAAPSSSQPTP
jgi:hypothetical protein